MEGHGLIHDGKVNHSQAPRVRGEAATAGVNGRFLGPMLSPPRAVSSSGPQHDTAGVDDNDVRPSLLQDHYTTAER